MGKAARRKRESKSNEAGHPQASGACKGVVEQVVGKGLDLFKTFEPERAVVKLTCGAQKDASVASDEFAKRNGIHRACRDKCSHCCTVRVAATAPEVLIISEHLRRKLPADQLTALRKTLRRLAAVVETMNRDQWQEANIACPLLVDDSCSVHQIRPLACIGWSSVDVEDCKHARGKVGEVVSFVGPQWTVCNDTQVGVMQVMRMVGLQADPVELITGLDEALSIPDAVDAWFSGQFKFARAVRALAADSQLPSFESQARPIDPPV